MSSPLQRPSVTAEDELTAAIGADRVLMLANAVYSVITVEGCAAILWKDGKSPEMKERAASALRLTAQDLLRLAARAEYNGNPPEHVRAWLEDQGATLLDPGQLRARVVAARAG